MEPNVGSAKKPQKYRLSPPDLGFLLENLTRYGDKEHDGDAFCRSEKSSTPQLIAAESSQCTVSEPDYGTASRRELHAFVSISGLANAFAVGSRNVIY
jgi:hypothetical protein